MNPILFKFLPGSIRSRLQGRPHLQQVLANTGWLFGDRALRMGFGLIVGVWVTRYLGPGNYGLLNYAQAFVALFTALATLGLDRIVVRDLIQNPGEKGAILGTTLALRLGGAMVAILVQGITVYLSRPEDIQLHLLVAILGSAMVFQSFDSMDLWFQSRVQSKFSVLAKNAAFLAVAGLKVGLILTGAPLVAFAWATLAEAALGAFFLLVVYRRQQKHLLIWRVDRVWAKSLVRDGWPMVLSGLAVMIYMRIDQIMLGQMWGNHEVGIYSAAVRISEIWYFVPVAIVSSAAPAIVKAKQLGEAVYLDRNRKLFRGLVVLSLGVSILLSLSAGWIVRRLFGEAYAAAGPVLAIHAWTSVFVALAIAQGPWMVAEGHTMLALRRAIAGAVVNLVLNLLFIPKYGCIAAAINTLVAQAFAATVVNAFSPKTRPLFRMQMSALRFWRN